MQGTTVFDGFGGVGGSAIAFAMAGKSVIFAEIDHKRFEMAKHNAKICEVFDKISFNEGDFFEIGKTVNTDTVYIDTPWGGPHYRTKYKNSLLKDFSPDGNKILPFALARFREIVLCVPLTFDMKEILRYTRDYEVFEFEDKGKVISRTVVIRNK
jgi:trimethylguanosine synthase